MLKKSWVKLSALPLKTDEIEGGVRLYLNLF
jgi:hypothetical protein